MPLDWDLWQSPCCKALTQQGPWGLVRSGSTPAASEPLHLVAMSQVVIFLPGGMQQLRGRVGSSCSEQESLREVKQCEELSPTNILQMTINSYRKQSCGPEQLTHQDRIITTKSRSSFQHFLDIFWGPRALLQVPKV